MRIAMPRGDIKMVRFLINKKDGTEMDIDFTEIYFTVKKKSDDKSFEFQKKLSTNGIVKLGPGDYQLKIEPQDTENMMINNIRFPRYVFDVQFQYENQVKETFVGTFVLTDEVTRASNE